MPQPTVAQMNAAETKFNNQKASGFSGTVTYKDKDGKTVTKNKGVYGEFLMDKAQNSTTQGDWDKFIKWVDDEC